MQKPKKWYDVYPYGTKGGDEEAKVFRALSRHPKFDYRSTGAIMKATGISRERIEEIIDKYMTCDPPLIFAHPSNEEHWGYWERCPDRLKDDDRDIAKKDKEDRIDKHLAGADMVVNSSHPLCSNYHSSCGGFKKYVKEVKKRAGKPGDKPGGCKVRRSLQERPASL